MLEIYAHICIFIYSVASKSPLGAGYFEFGFVAYIYSYLLLPPLIRFCHIYVWMLSLQLLPMGFQLLFIVLIVHCRCTTPQLAAPHNCQVGSHRSKGHSFTSRHISRITAEIWLAHMDTSFDHKLPSFPVRLHSFPVLVLQNPEGDQHPSILQSN